MPQKLHQKCTNPRFYALLRVFFKSHLQETASGFNGSTKSSLFMVVTATKHAKRALGVARPACFEELAGVFASSCALHSAKILASLKIKNGI